MEKRIFLAFALSMGILLLWSNFVSKQMPPPAPVTSRASGAVPIAAELALPVAEAPAAEPALSKIAQDRTEMVLVDTQGALKEVIFKAYQSYKFPLKYGFFLKDPQLNFTKVAGSAENAVFAGRDNQKQVSKRFDFHNSNYTIELSIEIQNTSALPLTLNTPLVLGVLNFSGDQNKARFQDVTVQQKEKISRPSPHKDALFPDLKFLSIRDRYFCAIIQPASANYTGYIKKISPQESEVGVLLPNIALAPGAQIKESFRIYMGPQELQIINQADPSWTAIMNYGMFDAIAQMLLQAVGLLYRLVHNWGLAIVLLSILIYLILYPLSAKQMHSMKAMQALQPRVEEIKRIYKDNPQKQNKEIMELYRQNKVNPLGGCLPMLLQLPVFWALYQALIRSIALKGAHFLWIKDLSEPDQLFVLPSALPVIGDQINMLPILMGIGMFAQQKLTSGSMAGAQAEQQKIMLILFPVMFIFIFYHMPSGLVLYWFVNSILMLLYQVKIQRNK
jgi:YidC/Oxa1 family membrane protein insertase